MWPPPDASPFLTRAFAAFAIGVAAMVVACVYLAGYRLGETRAERQWRTIVAAVVAAIWLSACWLISASGILAQFDWRPPPMMFMFVVLTGFALTLGMSRFGARLAAGLPLWLLVLTQGFRLPLEWLMHRAAIEGVMPVQMSYAGNNFDFLTGLTAFPVAWLLATGRAGRKTALAWNIGGSVLLANIVTIAIVSTPTFSAFGPDRLNTWVAYPPFVWLPTVMVVWAIAGHAIVARKLMLKRP